MNMSIYEVISISKEDPRTITVRGPKGVAVTIHLDRPYKLAPDDWVKGEGDYIMIYDDPEKKDQP